MAKRTLSRRAGRRLPDPKSRGPRASKELPLNDIVNVRLEAQRGQLLRARSICNLAAMGIVNAPGCQSGFPVSVDDFESAATVVSQMLLSVINELDTVNLLRPKSPEPRS